MIDDVATEFEAEFIEKVLKHEYSNWDLGKCTIREYLLELANRCWIEKEGFSGKRPFGNGGWHWDLFSALADGGFITGVRQEDGWIELDTSYGEKIVVACFSYLKICRFVGEVGLTDKEKIAMSHLVNFWNAYVSLDSQLENQKNADSISRVRDAVHAIQSVFALRVARRVNPEYWS